MSDLSGEEVNDETHARLLISHPDFPGKILELDASVEEGEKFQNSTLRLMTVTVLAPNVPPREVTLETKKVDAIFKDFDTVLQGARVSTPARATSAPAKKAASKSSGGAALDYTSPENYGLIHRGRITEEEAKLVRENMAQANANRERVGQPKVGDDPKDAARYGL